MTIQLESTHWLESPIVRAAVITEFGRPLEIRDCEDPLPSERGVVLRVIATGICLSDWHAWMGHETLPSLPHVPGHEMAGFVESVGAGVRRWQPGDRVTVPFSVGCGLCPSCRLGHLNTCDRSFTPGFTHWGSFAELVAVDHADLNLVRIPDGLAPEHAAALGCRFITSFRAVVDRGRLVEDEWLAVHGCGGVGLSAVMIAVALGAHVIAVDVDPRSLELAAALGAEVTVDARSDDVIRVVADATGGGAHVSVDAVGTTSTVRNSIGSLRKRGRHVQVGLLLGEHAEPPIPMEQVIMGEMEILGSRGMPATDYPRVFELIELGGIDLGRLVTSTVSLDEASGVLSGMGGFGGVGVTVIDRF
jgi:alcohol dehydrogenase